MADLFQRITTNPDNEKTISGHYLPGAIISYHNGKRTAQAIKTFFAMDAGAGADFDAIITHFDSLTQLQKIEFMFLIEGANTEIELGLITTKAEYAAYLGI